MHDHVAAPAGRLPASRRSPARVSAMVLSALLALLLSVLAVRAPLRPSALTMAVSSRRTQMPQLWVRGAAPSCRRLEGPADGTPMRFCEDARVVPELGIALFSCDPLSLIHI